MDGEEIYLALPIDTIELDRYYRQTSWLSYLTNLFFSKVCMFFYSIS